MRVKPEATSPMPDNNLGCVFGGLAFSGVFAVAGAALLYWGFVVPLRAIQQSQTWVETPCEILESDVTETHGSPHGSTSGVGSRDYSLKIKYRYQFHGHEYVSQHYGVTNVGDTKEGWRRDVVKALPRGTHTVCYVNPDNPEQAAISREFHANYRVVLLPIAFLLLGLLGIGCTLYARVSNKSASPPKTRGSA